MPIYEYACNTCGTTFEKLVSFSEAKNTPICPECGSDETKKKLSTIAAPSGFGNGGGSSSSTSGCGSSGRFS
jgi:putative FmdB family regulatory protein